MEEPINTFDRPDWWQADDDEAIRGVLYVVNVDELQELFTKRPELIFNATDLWDAEADARINYGERVLSQHQFERFTSWLMGYADRVGVYAPYLWEVKVMLSEPADPDDDGEDDEQPATLVDEPICRRLLRLARGELNRLRMATPGFLADMPTFQRPRASVNDPRDKYIYDERQKNPPTPYSAILKHIKSVKGWAIISSDQGARRAADRYAKREQLPPIPKEG